MMRTAEALLVAALATCLALPAAAQTGTGVVVRGVVLGSDAGRPIASATVLLGDSLSAVTGASGEFEFGAVRPGSYSIVVRATGYATVRTRSMIMGPDPAVLTIRLDVAPVELDPLDVRPARATLRGTISAAESGRRVPYATARLRGNGEASANDRGVFRFGDIAQGTHALSIEAFGWLPYRTELVVEGDSAVTIELARDPVMQRMIAEQLAHIDARSRGEPGTRRVVERRWFEEERYHNPLQVIRALGIRAGSRRNSVTAQASAGGVPQGFAGEAVYIDDVRVCGLAALEMYPNALFERMEVLDNGRHIRLYTTAFIERMLARGAPLAGLPPRGWGSATRC